MNVKDQIEIYPATAERWPDLEALLGQHGAYAGCWCMFWRLSRTDFKQMKGEGTKAVLCDMTLKNEVPGLLAYDQDQAVGWCSVEPREHYLALENSRILKRIDDLPVWSVVCFFVAKSHRGRGVMLSLLRGAVQYAQEHNAKIVEGYPIDMQSAKLEGRKLTGCSGYMGIASVFREVGFIEVGRASNTQLIMRYMVGIKPV